MSIDKLSNRVWPVAAISAFGGADNSPAEDSERQRPEHQALADKFSQLMAQDVTKATISPEAVALRDAEEAGAKVTFEPLDPRIAAYLHNSRR